MFGFLVALLSLSSTHDCGDGLGRAALISIDSSPAQPKAGDNVTLSVIYDLPEPAITSGIAIYSYAINNIPFSPTSVDLCTQTACPIEPGIHNETSVSAFPSISGKVVAQIAWYDQQDELVWCVESSWKT
jgi:hypothetical protein